MCTGYLILLFLDDRPLLYEGFDNMEGCVAHYIGVAESPYDWGGSCYKSGVIEKEENTIFKILRWMIIQVALILQ